MLTYLERCFDEKSAEIIYLKINLLLFSANKAVAGNLCVQSDIFSQHRAFKEPIYLCSVQGKKY